MIPRDPGSLPGSPKSGEENARRRLGIVFNDSFEEPRDDSEPGMSSLPPPQMAKSPTATHKSLADLARPRTRTLDTAFLPQRSGGALSDYRQRVGSVSSSVSQALRDDPRTPVLTTTEISTYSGYGVGRAQDAPPTPSTPGRSKEKKSSAKRLLKRQASRPSSPIPPSSPSVDAMPIPIDTTEPKKIIMLMKTLGGRMRGEIELQKQEGEPWQRGEAYIDDERGSLMFQSGYEGAFQVLISDLRGSMVLPVEDPADGRDCLELVAAESMSEILLRPLVNEEWNLWLATLLCWQQTRPSGLKASNGGDASPAGLAGSGLAGLGLSADGSKGATIIKVGNVLLWDKGATTSPNELVQRPSARPTGSSAASWIRISTILHDNGELKLLIENESSSLCTIQLSQLSRCAIQQLDRTVLAEEFCLAIFPIYSSTADQLSVFRPVYLALDNRVHFEVWFVLLRAFTAPEIYRLDAKDRDSIKEIAELEQERVNDAFRVEKTVGVRVTEAKVKVRPSALEDKGARADNGDAVTGNYLAEVILDGEVRSRTAVKTATKNPYWREDCEIVDLPHTSKEVSIVLKRTDANPDSPASARGSTPCQETLFGTVHISLDKLERGKDHEDWLQIMSDNKQVIGSMLVKVTHAEQIALLAKEYEPLSEILHRFPTGLTTLIAASLPGQLRRLAEIFLNIFQASGSAGDWLMALVEDEIDGIGSKTSMKKFRFSSRLKSTESMDSASDRELMVRDISKSLAGEANLLFRGNTLLTQSLEFHMRRLGTEYLETVLQEKIMEINDINPDCEVDTSKLHHPTTTDMDQRWNRLIQYTTEVWQCIAQSANQLPAELRLILKYIRAVADDRYGDFHRTVTYTAVSGFLFLRFVCPAILSPKLFGLLRDHPRPRAQRTLTLIAKVLQKMSNISTFGKREEWMEPMNRFLTTQRPVFRDYIDEVCGIPTDRAAVRTVPASYSTPLTMLGRLSPAAREGFPSLPYLIDQTRSLANLVKLWTDWKPDEAKKSQMDGELLIFNDMCMGLQARTDACLAELQRTRAAEAASRGVVEQLAQSLEQATLLESLSMPYVAAPPARGDYAPDSSGSESSQARRKKEASARKASHRHGTGTSAPGKSRNGKVGRTILNGIMRIGGRAESPDAKGQAPR